jgi:hypothetical protein
MHVRRTHNPKDKRARAASTDTRVVAERLYWLKGATLKKKQVVLGAGSTKRELGRRPAWQERLAGVRWQASD